MQSFNGGVSSAPFRKSSVFWENAGFCTGSQPWYHICWALNAEFSLFFCSHDISETLDYHDLIHPQLIYTLWTSCAPKLWFKKITDCLEIAMDDQRGFRWLNNIELSKASAGVRVDVQKRMIIIFSSEAPPTLCKAWTQDRLHRTQRAFNLLKATYFPNMHVAATCGLFHVMRRQPLIRRELWMFMCQNVNRWQSQEARRRLEEGVKRLIFHLQVNEAFWGMFWVKWASVMP